MSYQIDAYLDRGVPSLRLIDAQSGEARLHWQQPKTSNETEMRQAWQGLFRRLMVLSCADRKGPCGQRQLMNSDVRPQTATGVKAIGTTPLPPNLSANAKYSNVVYLPVRRSGVAR